MSPILGIYASQISGHLYTNSYTSIATATVDSGGSATVTFSSIPSTYTHLQIRCIGRTTNASAVNLMLQVGNGSVDTGNNYAQHYLSGNGATVSAGAVTSTNAMLGGVLSADASIFNASIIDILDYGNTNKYKTIRALSGFDRNGSSTWLQLQSGLWQSTAAINTITLYGFSANLAQYSQFALYGVN